MVQDVKKMLAARLDDCAGVGEKRC